MMRFTRIHSSKVPPPLAPTNSFKKGKGKEGRKRERGHPHQGDKMHNEEFEMLLAIFNFVRDDPSRLQGVLEAATKAVGERQKQYREHAVDMEIVASMSLNHRLFKGNENFIADKLERWKDLNSVKWDAQIEELRKRGGK